MRTHPRGLRSHIPWRVLHLQRESRVPFVQPRSLQYYLGSFRQCPFQQPHHLQPSQSQHAHFTDHLIDSDVPRPMALPGDFSTFSRPSLLYPSTQLPWHSCLRHPAQPCGLGCPHSLPSFSCTQYLCSVSSSALVEREAKTRPTARTPVLGAGALHMATSAQ